MSFFTRPGEDDNLRLDRSSTLRNSVTSFHSIEGGERKLLTKQNLMVVNIKLLGKDKHQKQPECTICNNPFTVTFRQHHCRVCANAVCSRCSAGKINEDRACDVCYLKWSDPNREERKEKLISCLETLCGSMIALKEEKIGQLSLLKKQKIDPSEYIRVDQAELTRCEEEAGVLRAKRDEIQTRTLEHRRKSEELALKIKELDDQLQQ